MSSRTCVLGLAALAVTGLLASSVQAADLAAWNLNEGSGTVAADSSGNGYNGTLKGTSLPVWGVGNLVFAPGTENRVETTFPTSMLGGNALTIDITFSYNTTNHAADAGTWQPLLGSSTAPFDVNQILYVGKMPGSDQLCVNLAGWGYHVTNNPTAASLFDGAQHRVVIDYDSSRVADTIRLFADGASTSFDTYTGGSFIGTSPLWIGATGHGYTGANGEVWAGTIDNVLISVPEPASIGFLGLAAIALFRPRRV